MAARLSRRDGSVARLSGVTGKTALICPVPELPKYGVTISAGAS